MADSVLPVHYTDSFEPSTVGTTADIFGLEQRRNIYLTECVLIPVLMSFYSEKRRNQMTEQNL